jgi:hypothetical protein
MLPAFNDPLLQKQFDQKGYVLLPSLLSDVDIRTLTDLFVRFQSECIGPFHTSHFSTDVAYKKQTHDTIVDVVFPKVAPYLNDFAPLFGNFMVKNPDPTVALDLHADWTYVDEQRFNSVAVWVPLIDVDAQNGCLGVIDGSQKVTNKIRGPLIRQSSRDHESEWEKRYGKLLPMKAGDAIIYDHALLHYSQANKTSKARPALNLSLAPAQAPWIHYCMPEGAADIEMYSVTDTEFYIKYNHFKRPDTGRMIQKISPSAVQYMDERMHKFWRTRLFNKLKNWI